MKLTKEAGVKIKCASNATATPALVTPLNPRDYRKEKSGVVESYADRERRYKYRFGILLDPSRPIFTYHDRANPG